MITKQAKKLREEFIREDALPEEVRSLSKLQKLSDKLMQELVDQCKPTEPEFVEMTTNIVVTASTLYRILTGRYKL